LSVSDPGPFTVSKKFIFMLVFILKYANSPSHKRINRASGNHFQAPEILFSMGIAGIDKTGKI